MRDTMLKSVSNHQFLKDETHAKVSHNIFINFQLQLCFLHEEVVNHDVVVVNIGSQ